MSKLFRNAKAGRRKDRRESDRVPFPVELVIVWNHDLSNLIRYRVIDAGDGGYRIHTSEPMIEGMTGMILRILPGKGESVDQAVSVSWTHACPDGSGYESGLHCL